MDNSICPIPALLKKLQVKKLHGLTKVLAATVTLFTLCLLTVLSNAQSETRIAMKTEGQPEEMLVNVHSSSTGERLYLPSGTDLSRLQLFYDGDLPLSINGQELTSGELTDAFAKNSQVSLTIGKDKQKLVTLVSSNLPSIFLTTESGNLDKIHESKENSEKGTYLIADQTGTVLISGNLEQIRGRGETTFRKSKRPYQIKLDKSKNLLGLGEGKTWVLLANYLDNSLLRNKVAFDLAAAVNMNYVMDSVFVDLYINGSYMGNYQLCEKIQIRDTRVDIFDLEKATEDINTLPMNEYLAFGKGASSGSRKGVEGALNPEDITGGYLMEIDISERYVKEVSGFVTELGVPIVIKSPEYATRDQVDYIANFIQGFERAIHASDGVDSATGKHYSQYIDMDSLVKKTLLEEITKNYDGNKTSQYIYKPEDSQGPTAFLGPPWDYDYSMGNFAKEYNKHIARPNGLFITTDDGNDSFWYPALYKHSDFYEAMLICYYEKFVPALNILTGKTTDESGVLMSIQSQGKLLSKSAEMNFNKQNVFNSSKRLIKTGSNYQENIDYLVTWLQKRMDFLDTMWLKDYQVLGRNKE